MTRAVNTSDPRLAALPGQKTFVVDSDGNQLELESGAAITPGGGTFSPLAVATLQGWIYVDPQNVTGVASDTAPPTITPATWGQPGPVYRTFRGVAATWGTVCPVLTQDTFVAFVSSHTDATDPVVWMPYCFKATPYILANPTVTGQPALLNLGAKNRAAGTNNALSAQLGGGSIGALVFNTTHSSFAWGDRAFEGDGAQVVSQPFVPNPLNPATPVPINIAPAQVNTWANGDTVAYANQVAVYLTRFSPVTAEWNAGFTNNGQLMFVQMFDPTPGDRLLLGNVFASQVDFQARTLLSDLSAEVGCVFVNCRQDGSMNWGGAPLTVNGGIVTNLIGWTTESLSLDGDVLLDGNNTQLRGCHRVLCGFVCMNNAQGFSAIDGGYMQFANGLYAGTVLYTSGTAASATAVMVIRANGRMNFPGPQGTGKAAATFTYPTAVAGSGFQLNGVNTAASLTGAGAVNNAITITLTALDTTPAGAAAFAGLAYQWAGASIGELI